MLGHAVTLGRNRPGDLPTLTGEAPLCKRKAPMISGVDGGAPPSRRREDSNGARKSGAAAAAGGSRTPIHLPHGKDGLDFVNGEIDCDDGDRTLPFHPISGGTSSSEASRAT